MCIIKGVEIVFLGFFFFKQISLFLPGQSFALISGVIQEVLQGKSDH